MPFNFLVLFSLQNSRNKGHANIKGFTVFGKGVAQVKKLCDTMCPTWDVVT